VLTKGLVIYNTTTNCMEYWNLLKWVSLCAGQANISFDDVTTGKVDTVITKPPFTYQGGVKGPFVVRDSPNCQGKDPAYSFLVTSGAEYTFIDIANSSTGVFSIRMNPNETAIARNAVLRVVNNCTNEYKEFIFTQEGDIGNCGTDAIPDIRVSGNPGLDHAELCNNGAVYLYLPGANANGNYIWTLGNIERGRGTHFTATTPGTYTVYSGKIGCEATPSKHFTVSANISTAPAPVVITAANNGFVCGIGGTITLYATAAGAGEEIVWYKDGEEQAATGRTASAGIGQWFAVVKSGDCLSAPSNSISVIQDPISGAPIPTPEFTINGLDITGGVKNVCAGGMLLLDIKQPDPNVSYTWYLGQTVRGTGVHLELPLTGISDDFMLQCRATGNGCSTASIIDVKLLLGNAPAAPYITINTPGDAICNGTAVLIANTGGTPTSYGWYRADTEDGIYTEMSETSQMLAISQTGYYKAIAKNGDCVSGFSSVKAVTISTGSASVTINGPASVTAGETKTYTAIMDNPQGASYSWTIVPGSTGATPTSGSSSLIAVNFTTPGTATVKLTASNACGTAVVNGDYQVTVNSGCLDVAIDSHSPTSKLVSIYKGETENISIAVRGSQPVYKWYKPATAIATGGTLQTGAESASFAIPNNLAEGAHYYYCKVSSGCGTSEVTSGVFTVEIKPNPEAISTLKERGSFAGRMSFDVAQVNDGGDCLGLTKRKQETLSKYGSRADFNTDMTRKQTYVFTPHTTVSNVRFAVVEQGSYVGQIIESYSGGNSGTVTASQSVSLSVVYKSDLNTKARGKTNEDALQVKIYAIYTVGGNDEKVEITVSIKDCFSCGAYRIDGRWLNFMYYNLGADATKITPAQQHNAATASTYGTYYQWGSNGAGNRSTSSDAWGNGTKKNLSYDPCPTGFRVPGNIEFASIGNGTATNTTVYITTINATSKNTWTYKTTTDKTQGMQIGDFLFLPMAGYKNPTNLYNARNEGTYWTSTSKTGDLAGNALIYYDNVFNSYYDGNKNYSLSVRCVAEAND
jgi:uncharacterized protein (TIGR02145 family)